MLSNSVRLQLGKRLVNVATRRVVCKHAISQRFSFMNVNNTSSLSLHHNFHTSTTRLHPGDQKLETATNFHIQDEDDFKARVLMAKIPIIVDFHAEWCQPCKTLGPNLEKEVDKYGGKVMLAKVDVDDVGEVAMEYEISAIPTVILFKNGEQVSDFKGNVDDATLAAFVKNSLKEP
ncbi:putative thioredoxin-2 [Ciona intestinalis]